MFFQYASMMFPLFQEKLSAEAKCAWVLIYDGVSTSLRWFLGARWFLPWFSIVREGNFDYFFRWFVEWLFECNPAPSCPCQDGYVAQRGCRLVQFVEAANREFVENWNFLNFWLAEWAYRCKGWLSIKWFLKQKAVKLRVGPIIGMWVACQSIWVVTKKQ